MDLTKRLRCLLCESGLWWRHASVDPNVSTVVEIDGVRFTAHELDNDTLRLVAYGLTPEQVVAVVKGGGK